MLIGGDDISNDVITLGTRFFCLFTFALIGGNLTTQSAGSSWEQLGATGELEVEFKFQRRICKLSFHFPPGRQSASESLLAA